ncbi:MAG TPA: STAS domain-containing protein [bacterium]|nr:STAS domain-containing protein [bacterium]
MEESFEKMEIQIGYIDDVKIVCPVIDEITYKNTKDLLSEMKTEIKRDSRNIVMDMRHIEIIDSVSLGTLVTILKYAGSKGSSLAISNVSNQIKELFNLLNFTDVFRIYSDSETAAKALSKSVEPSA